MRTIFLVAGMLAAGYLQVSSQTAEKSSFNGSWILAPDSRITDLDGQPHHNTVDGGHDEIHVLRTAQIRKINIAPL